MFDGDYEVVVRDPPISLHVVSILGHYRTTLVRDEQRQAPDYPHSLETHAAHFMSFLVLKNVLVYKKSSFVRSLNLQSFG